MQLHVVEPTPRESKVVPPRNPKPVVTLGQPTVVRCWAVGYPRPTITWWRGTKMLPLSSQKYEQGRDMSLRIAVITLTDLGPYTCQAYNGLGRATSNTVTLYAFGPVKITNPRDRDYLPYLVEKEPEPATTTTTTTTTLAPTQPPVYDTEATWYPDHHYTAQPDVPHSGSLKAHITLTPSTARPGANVSLSCEVSGHPSPALLWYRDGSPLLTDDRVIDQGDELTLTDVTSEDSGVYTCMAQNMFGSVSSDARLRVEGVYVSPSCVDNPFFANCALIVRAKYCNNEYYARFCCRSCTIAGLLPSKGPHLG